MSRCHAEVSHLAGLFCFYKSQLTHEFVWHSNSSLVPKVPNRPIKSVMLRQSRFIQLVFDRQQSLCSFCLTFKFSHQCIPFRMYMEYGIPRALSFCLFCLYVYIGVGRFFY